MDGELDLSMSDLDEVPMKKIDPKKIKNLDLSNNRLSLLPKSFPTLTRLVILNLSKNEIKELPEDFGNLVQLRHLDLYSNQLQHLPLSFSKLKNLKWLDLKGNPLVATLAKVAGPCLDSKQCERCATDIVNFFVKLEQQVNADLEIRNKTRQKQLEINRHKQREEKKAKKKEKKKQKQKVQNVQKSENSSKSKSKKDNNNEKIKAAPESAKQGTHSILGKSFVLFLVVGTALFILTSVKVKHTEQAELFTKKMYASLLGKVPSDYRTYGVQFGVVVHDFHNKTGETTLKVIEFLREAFPQEKRQRAYDNCSNFLLAVFEKVKATYSSLVSR